MRFAINNVAADFKRFETRTSSIFKPARAVVAELAKAAKGDARAALRGARSGRRYGGGEDASVYRLVKRKAVKGSRKFKAYTASAPGEAPATRTRTLLAGIRSARVRGKRGEDRGFSFFVFASRRTAFYQRFLEFGTKARRRGGRILPRPLFTPLDAKYQNLLRARIPLALEQGIRELTR